MTALVPIPSSFEALQQDNISITVKEEEHVEEIVDNKLQAIKKGSLVDKAQPEDKKSSIEDDAKDDESAQRPPISFSLVLETPLFCWSSLQLPPHPYRGAFFAPRRLLNLFKGILQIRHIR